MTAYLTYLIVIPRLEAFESFFFAKGSAIVAEAKDSGYVLHYEGNVYNAINLHKFEERVFCAAGRKAENYPTGSILWAKRETFEQNFLVVGEFNYTRCRELVRGGHSVDESVVQTTQYTTDSNVASTFIAWTGNKLPK